jgi:hypothetical protein
VKALLAVLLIAPLSFADVQWSRLNGKVTKVDSIGTKLSIENKDGDTLIVKIDSDVMILRDKQAVTLREVKQDDKVTLFYHSRTVAPKETEDVPEGGFYKPVK